MSRTRDRRSQRLLAAFALLAFVIAGVMSRDHEAAVTHVRCEHGQLTHAATTGAGGPILAARSAASELGRLPGSTTPHEHEHCTLVYALHAISQPRQVAAVPVALVTARVATAVPRAIESRGGLYRTAPKTSPPA